MLDKYLKKIRGYVFDQKHSSFILFVSVASLVKCTLLFFVTNFLFVPAQRIGYFPDSYMYEGIANNLLSGHGFSMSLSSPFMPTMTKEPLYAFFIALIKSLPFGNINYVIFVQILLNPIIAILVYFIGKEVFNEKISRLSALLVVIIPIYGEMSLFIMPELIFILLLCAAVLCLLKAQNSMNLSWFISAGMLLGFSTLCRNIALPLLFIYPVVILFSRNKENIKRKGLALKLAVFMFSFAVVITPWMLRNQQKLGLFSVSRRGGELLAHQAFWSANFSSDEWKAYSLYLFSGGLAQKLFPKIIGKDLGEYEYRFLMRTTYVEQLLKEHREGEVERMLINSAIKDITQHPFKFFFLSSLSYVQTFKYFESIPLMLTRYSAKLGWIFSLFRVLLFSLGVVYTLLAFRGIFISRKLFITNIIVVLILYFHIVLTSMAIIPGGTQRHILPVTVFYSFFVVIAINKSKCVYS